MVKQLGFLMLGAGIAMLPGCGKDVTVTGITNGPTNTGSTQSTTTTVIHTMIGECDTGATPFGHGDGSAGNPYQICSATHLASLSSTSYANLNFIVVADIDLTNVTLPPFAQFSGVFDGQGHTITHYVGTSFFAESSGTIKNLSMTAANVQDSYRAGILLGQNLSGGQVINCHTQGAFVGEHMSGGLVGFNFGSITKSTANVTLSGLDNLGGLVGVNEGSITQSSAQGTIAASGSGSSGMDVGGFVGANGTGGTITNCYSTASVSGDSDIGGFVGNNSAAITNGYSTGAVAANQISKGGFSGANSGTITSSYWDTQTSGVTTDPAASGVSGENTSMMQTQSTFSGWNFASTWSIAGAAYPQLR